MTARIYQPAKTATQSGYATAGKWVLEYEPEAPTEADPLMGWPSSRDMNQQIQLRFETKEEAIEYARRNGVAYQVIEPSAKPKPRKARKPRAYADNFRWTRRTAWTH